MKHRRIKRLYTGFKKQETTMWTMGNSLTTHTYGMFENPYKIDDQQKEIDELSTRRYQFNRINLGGQFKGLKAFKGR